LHGKWALLITVVSGDGRQRQPCTLIDAGVRAAQSREPWRRTRIEQSYRIRGGRFLKVSS